MSGTLTDRKELTKLLSQMTYGDWLYKLVKAEMKKRGNWKDKARGKPFIKGDDERRKHV